jgi:hypothetical protein
MIRSSSPRPRAASEARIERLARRLIAEHEQDRWMRARRRRSGVR